MKKPQMILFDYGQTICTERWDDPLGGCRAVLEAAVENPRGVTPEQLDAAFWAMDTSLFRLSKDPWQTGPELCWHAFARSVFESLELNSPSAIRSWRSCSGMNARSRRSRWTICRSFWIF